MTALVAVWLLVVAASMLAGAFLGWALHAWAGEDDRREIDRMARRDARKAVR